MSAHQSVLLGMEEAASYLNSGIVEIIVGGKEEVEEAKTFYIHKELLTRRSPFFAKSFEVYATIGKCDDESIQIVKWKEGREGTIRLPYDDPEAFAVYVQLIYYGNLPICHLSDQAEVPSDATNGEQKRAKIQLDYLVGETVEHKYDVLSKLYVFCDKIQDLDAKKAVLEAFVESALRTRANGLIYYCTAFTIDYLYEYTIPSDPIRQFLTDCYVFKGCESWVSKREDAYPMEFLRDVMIGMLTHRTQPFNTDRLEMSEYYTWSIKDSETRKRDAPFHGSLVRAVKR